MSARQTASKAEMRLAQWSFQSSLFDLALLHDRGARGGVGRQVERKDQPAENAILAGIVRGRLETEIRRDALGDLAEIAFRHDALHLDVAVVPFFSMTNDTAAQPGWFMLRPKFGTSASTDVFAMTQYLSSCSDAITLRRRLVHRLRHGERSDDEGRGPRARARHRNDPRYAMRASLPRAAAAQPSDG